MTLAEWLKIQGAEPTDFLFYIKDSGVLLLGKICVLLHLNKRDYCQYHFLYRMVEGTLQKIDRPYITCTTCGQSAQIEKADGWCCYFENGNYCPDCEAKRKAQAVIQESLTTEKIKISPCPRCGSRNIRAWEATYFSNTEHSYKLFVCKTCYYENDSNAWHDDGNEYTDLTDKYEVE